MKYLLLHLLLSVDVAKNKPLIKDKLIIVIDDNIQVNSVNSSVQSMH